MALNKVNYQSGKTVITADNLNNIQDSIIELEKSEIIYLTGTLPEWQDRLELTPVNFTADKSYSEVLNMLKKGRNISFKLDNWHYGDILLPVIGFQDEYIQIGAVGGGIQVDLFWNSSNEFTIAWYNLDNERMKIRFYNYDENQPDASKDGTISCSCNVTFEELLNYYNSGNIIDSCQVYWHDKLLDTAQFRNIDSERGAMFASPIINSSKPGLETVVLFPDNTAIAQITYALMSDGGSGSSDDTLVVTLSGSLPEDYTSLRGFLVETDWVANYDYDTVLNTNKNIVFEFPGSQGLNRNICTFKNDYMMIAGSFITYPYCGLGLIQWSREGNKIYMTTSLLEEEIVPTLSVNTTTWTATCDCEYDWLCSQVHDNGYYINRAHILLDGVYNGLLRCTHWPASDQSFWFAEDLILGNNKVPILQRFQLQLHSDDTISISYLSNGSAPLEDLLWSSNSASVGQSNFISADLASKYHALKITGIIDYNPSKTSEYLLCPDRIIPTQDLKITLPTHTNYNSPDGVMAAFDSISGARMIGLWSNGFQVMPGSYDGGSTSSNYAASPSKIYGLRYEYAY